MKEMLIGSELSAEILIFASFPDGRRAMTAFKINGKTAVAKAVRDKWGYNNVKAGCWINI
ncbi:hypothetical protein [Chitinophaga sp. YIM B06452]|uniref:hypothetical protein n=1 Tax=Chitinophaga sp. YIM B06452 TaxID=3082158 RepID=UPI0031FF1922